MENTTYTYEIKTNAGTRFHFQSKKKLTFVCIGVAKNVAEEKITIISKTGLQYHKNAYDNWFDKALEKSVYDYGYKSEDVEFHTVREVANVANMIDDVFKSFCNLQVSLATPEAARLHLIQMQYVLNQMDRELKARA